MVRPEVVKLLEENNGEKIPDIEQGRDIFGLDTKRTGNKSKSKISRMHQTKNCTCSVKEKIKGQKKKIYEMMEEIVVKQISEKELLSNIYEELIHLYKSNLI